MLANAVVITQQKTTSDQRQNILITHKISNSNREKRGGKRTWDCWSTDLEGEAENNRDSFSETVSFTPYISIFVLTNYPIQNLWNSDQKLRFQGLIWETQIQKSDKNGNVKAKGGVFLELHSDFCDLRSWRRRKKTEVKIQSTDELY